MEHESKQSVSRRCGFAPVLIIVGVAIFLAVVGGVVWWVRSKPQMQTSIPTLQNQPTPTQGQSQNTQTQTSIAWNASPTFIKTIPFSSATDIYYQPNYQGTISVFSIGTFHGGEFDGKTAALATLYLSAPEFSTGENIIYAYFVSDGLGNPIAWDINFFHDNTGCYGGEDLICPETGIKTALGFTAARECTLNIFPTDLGAITTITTSNNNGIFSVGGYGGGDYGSGGYVSLLDALPTSTTPVAITQEGWQIVKDNNTQGIYQSVVQLNDYYLALPFGKAIAVAPEPDFMNANNDIPQLTWNIGTTSVASYRWGQYAYGWDDCYDNISSTQLQAGLIVTGTTVKGDPVYELDSQKYPAVYQCLHEKTDNYVYDPTTKTGSYQETSSYADFVQSHPMFFWRHPIGDLIAFVRSDVVPPAEKAKPVIYLYPQVPTRVNVTVSPIGGLVKTDPQYNSGWLVDALPNGTLINVGDGKQYPYLFWEGGKDGIVNTPTQGFVVAQKDIPQLLSQKLSLFGLNQNEQNDFLAFWVPKLSKAPYYFVTFISRSEIDRVSPMTITPKPNAIIRVLMDYKPLTAPISVEPLQITPTERSGFTVVEWGGIVRD